MVKTLLSLLLLIPNLSWGENILVNKKIICDEKEILKEIPLMSAGELYLPKHAKNYSSSLSGKYLNRNKEMYLYKNSHTMNDFNSEWMLFGFEFLPDNKIRKFDTIIRDYPKKEKTDTHFEKIQNYLDNLFDEDTIQIVRYPLMKTYTEYGFSSSEILLSFSHTVIQRIMNYNDGERLALGIGSDFLNVNRSIIELLDNGSFRTEYDPATIGDPTYKISIDLDGDGIFMALYDPRDPVRSWKPKYETNVVFGKFFRTAKTYDYTLEEETIYIKEKGVVIGEIDRFSLNYHFYDDYKLSSCEISKEDILEKFHNYGIQTRDYFESRKDIEEPVIIIKRDLKDRKI